MSNTLDKFPVDKRATNRYNWDDWKDGQVHELVSSKWSSTYDFDVPVESMRAMVYRHATNAGLPVRTAKTRAGLAIQFITEGDGEILEW